MVEESELSRMSEMSRGWVWVWVWVWVWGCDVVVVVGVGIDVADCKSTAAGFSLGCSASPTAKASTFPSKDLGVSPSSPSVVGVDLSKKDVENVSV